MNKILRYSFVALLAMIFGNVSAQDVTFDFTLETEEGSKQSVWGFPASSKNKQVEEQSFTYNGYTVKVAGSEGNGYYWHDKDHYLLFGKQGAYVTLPAFDFDVSKIEVEGNSGASASTKQNIFVGDEAVSTETTGAKGTNTYEIAEAYQAAGNVYTIKVTSSHNDQIKTIKIYKKGDTPVVTIKEPEFSVPGGTYYEPQTVSMSCEEGARILYTKPAGQDPEYTDDENVTGIWYDGNPLTISKTTTIKAMAVKDGKTSSIVSATYTIEELQTLSLAQAQAADKGAAVIVEGVVVASAANGAVLSDGTDYLYYYNTANPLTIGQKVRMSGQLGEYGGAKQLTSTATITELGTETVIQPTPVKLAASDFESIVTAKVAERKYVSFEGTLTISGNYFNIAIEGTEKAIGSIVKPKENLTELSGKKVVVTGYLMYVNSKYVYAVATSVEDASSAGINTISADKAKNGARYNLAGQKVNAGYKGVVIMNGQKVMQ